jgi:hypothetical protein
MRRALILWSVALAVVLAGFAITVAILGSTLYSAGGFVGSYLDALARKDATTARELPGVLASENSATDLLTAEALGNLTDIEEVRDHTGADGIHTVTFSYTLAGETTESDYRVRQTGSFLGLFPTWTFDSTPLGTIAVTVLHSNDFRANGVELTNAEQTAESGGLAVFVPGVYSFDHESTFLKADAIDAAVTEPGSVTAVQVNVQANQEFVAEVKTELNDFLDTCATQEVLLPTGCPFGKTFDNRVDTTPAWSIAEYPAIEIIPGDGVGNWIVPRTEAAAHLVVEVRSLFDGRRTSFDEDVPFDVSYTITIGPTENLSIQAQN